MTNKVQSLGGVSLAQAMRTRDNVPSMKGYDAQRFEAWLQEKRDAFGKELGRLAKAQEEVLHLRTENAELVAALSHKKPFLAFMCDRGLATEEECESWVKRSTRKTRKPRRFADEKFLPGSNNGYTAGRRIDPGFGIDGAVAPFDNWAKGIERLQNEEIKRLTKRIERLQSENAELELGPATEEEAEAWSRAWRPSADERAQLDDEEVDEGEEWVPSGDESEESDDEW